MNLSVHGQGGLEIQADAEFLERNGDSIEPLPGLNYRERKFSPCQEARLFVCFGQQVWFSQNLQQILLLQSLDHSSQVNIGPKEKDVKHVADSLGGLKGLLRGGGSRSGCGCGNIWKGIRSHADRVFNLLLSETAKLTRSGGTNGVSRLRGKEIEEQLAQCTPVQFRKLDFQHDLAGGGRNRDFHQTRDLGRTVFHHFKNLVCHSSGGDAARKHD